MGQPVIQVKLLFKALNHLYSAVPATFRRFKGTFSDVVCWIILLGGVITVGFTYLFRLSRFSHACGNDDDSRRVARPGRSTYPRDGSVLSRRGQRFAGRVFQNSEVVRNLQFNQEAETAMLLEQ